MQLENGNIYLDYNATTPLDPQVLEVMLPYLRSEFGNASSSHYLGQQASAAIEKARSQVASFIHCQAQEIIFTSGGTESNNMALKGVVSKHAHKGMHIVISAVEHPSVTRVAEYLSHYGFRLSLLPVGDQGVVNPSDLSEIITSKTVLVSVMHANNEVGSIQPIQELTHIAHEAGAIFHTDAAQSASKIPVHVDELNADLLTMAGHKIYAPKGIGVLYAKSGLDLQAMVLGASQESGRRAGTENVAAIVGMGKAAELAGQSLDEEMNHLAALRDKLQMDLKEAFPLMRINSSAVKRLPNTLSVSFNDLSALDIMGAMKNVMVSAGAACHKADGKGSGVLEAMRVPLDYQLGTLRLSLGKFSDASQINYVINELTKTIKYLQNQ